MGEKSKYAFIWGDYCPNTTIEWDSGCFRDLRSNEWNQVNNTIQVSRNNKVFSYRSKEDLKNDMERGRMFLDKEYAMRYLKEINELYKEQFRFFKKLSKIKCSKLSNKQLFALLKESFDRCSIGITYFRGTQVEGTHYLVKELMKHFNNSEASILMTPAKLDLANKEQIDWCKISSKPFSKRIMLKHAEKYPYIAMRHVTYDNVIDTLFQRYKTEKCKGIAGRLKKEKKELKKKQQDILKGKEEMKPVAELLQNLAMSRIMVKSCWAGNDFFVMPLFEEIAKRTKEDIKDLTELYFIDDIRKLLIDGKRLSKKEKENRKEITVGLWKDGKLTLKSGKEAENIAKKELGDIYQVIAKKEIKGMIANPGYARGIARILITNDVAQTRELRNNFKPGEILITEMTQPNIMDIASKAAALVTDEGGMLSHAAIISREFKIPCIVGTHTATSNFKEGDMVEVDANKGIVRKVSK